MTSPENKSGDSAYSDREIADFKPVFIIGPHRSGTTILYKLLMETGCFNVTTAFHVINHRQLANIHAEGREKQARDELERLFTAKGLNDREFDSMKITPDIPEEYAYALEFQGRTPMLTAKNRKSFTKFCNTVSRMQDPAKPLLLKNPFDVVNFLEIYSMFPHARFVFIYRNPADVINSQMKLMQTILKNRNEYVALVSEDYRTTVNNPAKLALTRLICSGYLPFLFRTIFKNVAAASDYTLQNIGYLGNAKTGLAYPELCREPAKTARRVLDFLCLSEELPRDYASLIQPRERNLLAQVAKKLPVIEKRNKEYCRTFGV